RALGPLLGRTEDAALTAQVSHILRRCVISTFDLAPDELTTAELIKSLQANRQVGPELTVAIGNFLKQCDQRKFAPTPPAARIDTVAAALQLIAKIESHRRQMPVANRPVEPTAASTHAV
ncbi:MAG TPA: hypothetical protein VH598_03215, partial [Verrucomicrobiae bacterium]|nr:hypothetical protein [Verrucomicrobiae bacterium]